MEKEVFKRDFVLQLKAYLSVMKNDVENKDEDGFYLTQSGYRAILSFGYTCGIFSEIEYFSYKTVAFCSLQEFVFPIIVEDKK